VKSQSALIQVEGRNAGIHLPELGLWLDPRGSHEFAFISHAHADHFSRPKRAICSVETAHLLIRRFGLKPETLNPLVPGESMMFDGWELRLVPAGHVVGSSMLHLTRLADGATLLYTGDFKTKACRTCEVARPIAADSLIMESTFGRPDFIFPAREETEQAIIRFVMTAIEDGEVPVLFAYALGKAQELAALLAANGLNITAHPAVIEMNEACREIHVPLPELLPWDADMTSGHVLLCPPNAVRSQKLRRLKRRRTAMVTGWGVQPSARYRYQVDEVFPLSDHADHAELHAFVEAVNPQVVFTVHGFTREFAAELRSKGRTAWSLFTADQLEWSEVIPSAKQMSTSIAAETPSNRALSKLNDALNEIAATASRLAKRRLLAAMIRSLDEDEMLELVRWLSGRSLKLGFGFSSMRMAMMEAFGLNLAEVRRVSDQQQDAARTARVLAANQPANTFIHIGIREFASWIDQLRATVRPLDAVHQLADLLRRLPPTEVEFVMRVLCGEFRIGSAGGLVEEAVAEAFGCDAAELARAHMLSGDLGAAALLARRGSLNEARLVLGVPVKVMLATPVADSSILSEKMGGEAVWLEDKYDGIRAQLHVTPDGPRLFSRDLRPLDAEFPELIENAKCLPACLLDGEIIAYEEGRRLSFFDLQKRLGRKISHRGQGSLFQQEEIPVRFIAFDLLHLDGRDTWNEPLERRRDDLENMPFAAPFELASVMRVSGTTAVDEAFKAARMRGNEGLLAKDPASAYQFGRRGQAWLKLKKFDITLDCVVVRAEQGHGRRAGVLSDYTFAVRDESNGALRVLGKAYSGLTDAEIEDLTEHFEKTTLETKRKVREVDPQIVLEIAFDSIRPSNRHDSGLALRFPRIKAIRHDKTLADIDTLRFARSLI
jgi:DNA ligase 1